MQFFKPEYSSDAMPIKLITPQSVIDQQIDAAVEQEKAILARRLAYIGEQCVNEARNLPSPDLGTFWDSSLGEARKSVPPHQPGYIDWTANLRSSIGYIVVMDGQVVSKSEFQPLQGKKGTGTMGSQEGQAYADRLASSYPQGVALIVVAGMNYAAYVQRKGYDVTAHASLVAQQLLNDLKIPANVKQL